MTPDNSTQSTSLSQMQHSDMGAGNTSVGKYALFEILVKNMVAQKVYLYVPFLFTEADLDYNKPFAKVTFFLLQMNDKPDIAKQKFWEKHKKSAKIALNNKRSGIATGMKKVFFGT